jgi:hypothetical protein
MGGVLQLLQAIDQRLNMREQSGFVEAERDLLR